MRFICRSSVARVASVGLMLLLAAMAWLVLVGGGTTASATTADGDVVLSAHPPLACTVGSDANCEGQSTYIQSTAPFDEGLVVFTHGGTAVRGSSESALGLFGV